MKLTFSVSSYSLILSLAVFVLGLTPSSSFAIVNMEALHFDKVEDKFSTDLDLMLSGSTGNSNTTKVAVNGQLSWVAKDSINLFLLGSQYGENNNIRSVNKAFVHYRYIHQISDMMDWELFSQVEKNEFTRLSSRVLLGAGLRFSVWNSERHHAFLGLGAFHSREETEFTLGLTDEGVKDLTRANFYLFSKYKVNSNLDISNVFYYQPNINHLSDYRVLVESKVDIKINQDLSFRLSLNLEHDSQPSQTIKKTDIGYMTGLKLSF